MSRSATNGQMSRAGLPCGVQAEEQGGGLPAPGGRPFGGFRSVRLPKGFYFTVRAEELRARLVYTSSHRAILFFEEASALPLLLCLGARSSLEGVVKAFELRR